MDHRISKDMISSRMTPSGEKAQEDLGRTQYGSNPSPNAFADAYKSMYDKKEEVINEHHKKDEDGNTIPHEGEEINEVAPLLAAPLIAKGLMAAKAGAAIAAKSKLGAAAVKGGLAFKKGLMATKAAKVTGSVVGGAKKVGMAQKAGSAVRSAGAAMKNNPMSTAIVGTSLKPAPKMPNAPIDRSQKMTGARTAGVYASADLFDIVKGQLLDEGIDEKDALKIMVELSQQDLNTIVNEGIGQMKLLPTLAGLGGAAVATKMVASRMGKKSGEDSIKSKKSDPIKDLVPNLKKRKEATEKAIQSM